jgi:hypothetical protein
MLLIPPSDGALQHPLLRPASLQLTIAVGADTEVNLARVRVGAELYSCVEDLIRSDCRAREEEAVMSSGRGKRRRTDVCQRMIAYECVHKTAFGARCSRAQTHVLSLVMRCDATRADVCLFVCNH